MTTSTFIPNRRGIWPNGKHDQAYIVRNILPECVFLHPRGQTSPGNVVHCAKPAAGEEPFAVLLADEFIISDGAGVTAKPIRASETTEKTQLNVMDDEGEEISK